MASTMSPFNRLCRLVPSKSRSGPNGDCCDILYSHNGKVIVRDVTLSDAQFSQSSESRQTCKKHYSNTWWRALVPHIQPGRGINSIRALIKPTSIFSHCKATHNSSLFCGRVDKHFEFLPEVLIGLRSGDWGGMDAMALVSRKDWQSWPSGLELRLPSPLLLLSVRALHVVVPEVRLGRIQTAS